MAQTDRNIFLSQLLKLNTFDELYQIASQDLKELSIVLKEFQKDNIEDKLIDAENELEENTKLLTKKIKEKNK
ncbi:MAG: hypothetical protein H8E13_00490, partial [Actinobacteria bacterium]|nr:hypothetical protein [Actinomycetota bacterium]